MPLSEEEVLEAVKPAKNIGAIQLLTGYSRSVGRQRNHNEDSLFALSSYLTDLTKEIPFGYPNTPPYFLTPTMTSLLLEGAR